jgi:hypothetical protein
MMFSFGIPKKNIQPPSFSWRPFIVMGVMLFAAFGLRIYQWIQGPEVPTADVPSVAWEDVGGGTKGDGESVRANEESETGDEGGEGSGEGEVPVVSDEPVVAPEDTPSSAVLPEAINLAVPFTSQAPHGIWDEFTEETCEEASFAMVAAYYAGLPRGNMDPAAVETDLRAMVAKQEELGFGVSISVAQFSTFSEAYNGTSVRVIEDPTVDDLRALLAAGHPVLVPAYGRALGNPFFTGEGPLYHMLVLRGYTPTSFIANDPGTRHGENYQYPIETLMQAIGDWDGDSPDGGSRVMIFDRK